MLFGPFVVGVVVLLVERLQDCALQIGIIVVEMGGRVSNDGLRAAHPTSIESDPVVTPHGLTPSVVTIPQRAVRTRVHCAPERLQVPNPTSRRHALQGE